MKKIPCNVGAPRKVKPSSNCIVIVASHLKINYSYIIVLLFKSCMECNTLAILYVMLYQLLWCHSATSLTTFHPYACGFIEMIQKRTLLMSSKCPRKSEPICRQPKNQSAEAAIYPSCMESHLMEASMIAKLKLQVNTKKFDTSASQNTH